LPPGKRKIEFMILLEKPKQLPGGIYCTEGLARARCRIQNLPRKIKGNDYTREIRRPSGRVAIRLDGRVVDPYNLTSTNYRTT
jgi:hypothetical protein